MTEKTENISMFEKLGMDKDIFDIILSLILSSDNEIIIGDMKKLMATSRLIFSDEIAEYISVEATKRKTEYYLSEIKQLCQQLEYIDMVKQKLHESDSE